MYDELVYHLDLCTLAYQLHGQSLIWPMDPYLEQLLYTKDAALPSQRGISESRRQTFMWNVESHFTSPPPQARYRGGADVILKGSSVNLTSGFHWQLGATLKVLTVP
jgi:hypothetical protein